MSNVTDDRRVENDWWAHPIPPNVHFGEGFYCETAQIFRFLKSKNPRAAVLGKHVSCYAGCSFALGINGTCSIGDFTLVNGALIMAEERIEIGSYCLISWNVGIADSDFHPLEPAQRLIDAEALAHEVFYSYLKRKNEIRNLHAWLIGAICHACPAHGATRSIDGAASS